VRHQHQAPTPVGKPIGMLRLQHTLQGIDRGQLPACLPRLQRCERSLPLGMALQQSTPEFLLQSASDPH
jgi:hypothetical protein